MNQKRTVSYSNLPSNGEVKINPDDAIHLETTQTKIKNEQKNARNDMLGFFLGIIASVGLTVGVGCVQALQRAVPHFEINAIRFIFLFLVTSTMFVVRREPPKLARTDIIYVGMYAVMVNIFSLTLYASVGYIPMGIAGSITRIISMFVVLPLAKICLGETITPLKILGVLIGSVGLVLVCKPDLFYTKADSTPMDNINVANLTTPGNHMNISHLDNSTNLGYNSAINALNGTAQENPTDTSLARKPEYLGYIFAAISALNSVLHSILQKSKLPKVDASKLCFWFSLSGILVCTILSAVFEEMTLPKDFVSWGLILGHCAGVCIMSLSSVYAQKIASSIIVQLALSLQIFFFFIGQYFFLQTIFPTDGTWIEILGAVLSATSVTLVPAIQLVATKWKCSASDKAVKH